MKFDAFKQDSFYTTCMTGTDRKRFGRAFSNVKIAPSDREWVNNVFTYMSEKLQLPVCLVVQSFKTGDEMALHRACVRRAANHNLDEDTRKHFKKLAESTTVDFADFIRKRFNEGMGQRHPDQTVSGDVAVSLEEVSDSKPAAPSTPKVEKKGKSKLKGKEAA